MQQKHSSRFMWKHKNKIIRPRKIVQKSITPGSKISSIQNCDENQIKLQLNNWHYFRFVFISSCFVCPSVLPVSLDYLILIAPSVFSNIYLNIRETVPSISTASSSMKASATDWSISILTSFDGKSSFWNKTKHDILLHRLWNKAWRYQRGH